MVLENLSGWGLEKASENFLNIDFLYNFQKE